MNAGHRRIIPVFISILALTLVTVATYPVRVLAEWASSGWSYRGTPDWEREGQNENEPSLITC